MKLSIVVPCYNEAENIVPMYKRLSEVVKKLAIDCEYVYIDNGSTDDSEAILRNLQSKDKRIVVLKYSRNFGPHGAYTGGLEYTTGDVVVCIDGDLQDPPEMIKDFVEKWRQGYKVVYGIRKKRKASLARRIGYKLYYRLLKRLSYIDIPLDASDFALMDRQVVDLINAMPEHNKYIAALRAWVGFKQIGIVYARSDRYAGETKFRMFDYYRWALQGIFSFSYKPLELISYLAIFVVLLSCVAIVVYFLVFMFFPDTPRGFPTLLLIVLFLGGVQLLCLSIMGQYIASIFEEVKNRPRYIVEEIKLKR